MFQYHYIDPVAFAVGPLQVRWYGLMYLLGFLAAWWLGRRRIDRWRGAVRGRGVSPTSLDLQQFDDLLLYCIVGVVLGGRIGYMLFYQTAVLLKDPMYLLRVWEGGMSFHGGLVGVIIAGWWFAQSNKLAFFQVTDFLAPLVPIGLGLGRVGNFINGELWGIPTGLSWWGIAVPCDRFPILCLSVPSGVNWSPPLHPTQLYEAGLEGVVLFWIMWTFSSSPRPIAATSGLFLVAYALIRGIVELVRQPDPQLGYLAFGWLTMGQLLSIPMLIIGLLLLVLAYTNGRPPLYATFN